MNRMLDAPRVVFMWAILAHIDETVRDLVAIG